jgi:acetyl esterase/lipase
VTSVTPTGKTEKSRNSAALGDVLFTVKLRAWTGVTVGVAVLSAAVVAGGLALADTAGSRNLGYSIPAPGSTVANVAYASGPAQTMDFFYPSTPGPHPVMVWIHGGGWISGSKAEGLPDYLDEELARNNFVGVAIDYRLAGHAADGTPIDPFPAAVEDVKTAVRFLKANAGRYDLRANEIVLAGVSAGGHLAALAGTSAAVGLLEPQAVAPGLAEYDSRVRAVIDVVGISDVKAWGELDSMWARDPVAAFLGCPKWTGGEVACPEDAYAPASVAPYLSVVAPPVYLAYATQDALVPPAQHGRPLAMQWTAAKGAANVFYDESATQSHDLNGQGIDRDRLRAFIDGVLAGSIH